MQCPKCSGSGWNYTFGDLKEDCQTCDGTGEVKSHPECCPRCERRKINCNCREEDERRANDRYQEHMSNQLA